MKKLLIAAILLSTCWLAKAQTNTLMAAAPTELDWKANPTLHTVDTAYAKEAAVIVYDARMHQYLPDEKQGVIIKSLSHRVIRVNNEKGVEMYNKIYIPVSYGATFDVIKARVITPSGKVVPLPADKILDEEDEGRLYKKFALEGVEVGSEIEYYVLQKKGPNFFGIEVFQAAAPVQQAVFRLAIPQYLQFTVKGYNGFEVFKDTIIEEERIVNGIGKNIPVLEDEKYAQPSAYSRYVQYKLSYNLSKDKDVRMFTWNQLAKNVHENYTKLEDKEAKAIAGFLKKTNLDPNVPEEAKIIALEDYLKTNISINEEGIGEDAELIEKIVKTKVASNDGFRRFFAACLNQLDIGYQIVFPSKRNEIPLDEKVENFRMVDELLFFFPATGKYLDPTSISYRYPYFSPLWAATTGLYLQNVSVGTMKTAYAAFKAIPIEKYSNSQHNTEVKMKLNESLDSVLLHGKQIFMGLSAANIRPAYHFLPKDKQEDFTKDLMQSISKSKEISNMKVHNSAMTDASTNKPLILEADMSSAELLEQAGKKILVKLGEVIGPQEQMYQEKPRQLPISIDYPHILDRLIEFELPAGYTVKNIDDLKINITDGKDGGEGTMGFISSYELKGNKLLVKVHEYYKEIGYPLSEFEAFRKVINAAADFNKIVLVLEKQ
ncbi:MAG: DUF3857 domain-containing protein [Chitinophagaceae bacterium]|nr:DUF3857 domain-containing protein [Chitinophagaceae bacterium]